MSRILRHVGYKDFKRTRQRQIDEQKKLADQKLKEWQEAEKERRQIEEAARPYKSDWRTEITEGMTTAGMGMVYLDGIPNAISSGVDGYNSSDSEISTLTGGRIQLGVPEGQSFVVNVQGSLRTQLRDAYFDIDSSRIDTLVINMSGIGGGAPFWQDPNPVRRPTVNYIAYKSSDPFGGILSGTFSNGDNTISLPSSLRVSDLEIYIYQYASNGDFSGGYNPPSYINSITTKRLSPMSLFVALDDPEANSFIRGGLGGDKERRKRLKDQLEASNELMDKLGLEPSKTSPGDIELAKGKGGTMIAAAGNPRGTGGKSAGDPENIQWPRNKYPNKKAPPGPGYRPPTA